MKHHHAFLIVQPDTSRIHMTFKQVLAPSLSEEPWDGGLGGSRNLAAAQELFTWAPHPSSTETHYWWQVGPWCLGKSLLYYWDQSLFAEKLETGELLLVLCFEALWQHCYIYGWNMGLRLLLKANAVFSGLSPIMQLCSIMLPYTVKW